jgi:hypothetical protein
MLDQAWESKGEESQKRRETLLSQPTSVKVRQQSLLRSTLSSSLFCGHDAKEWRKSVQAIVLGEDRGSNPSRPEGKVSRTPCGISLGVLMSARMSFEVY